MDLDVKSEIHFRNYYYRWVMPCEFIKDMQIKNIIEGDQMAA